MLSQIQEGTESVIAYFNKTLAHPEKNYCITTEELLSVVKTVKHFRPYLYCQKFQLQTNHAFLRWLCLRKEPSNQLPRWLEIHAEFPYVLEHGAGVKYGNVDGLSRRSCKDCQQCSLIERGDGGASRMEIPNNSPKPTLKVAGLKILAFLSLIVLS